MSLNIGRRWPEKRGVGKPREGRVVGKWMRQVQKYDSMSETATVPENGVKAGKDLKSKNAFTAIPPLFTPEGFVNPAAIRPNSHSC